MAGAGQEGEPSSSSSSSQQPPTSSPSAAAQPPAPPLTSTTDPVPTTTSIVGSPPPLPPPSASSRQPTLQLRRSSSGATKHNVTGARLLRRVTTQERLDGILELGRQRAESMSPGQSPPMFRSPLYRGSGSGTSPMGRSPFFRESDPDGSLDPQAEEPNETTGIVGSAGSIKNKIHNTQSAPSVMNYQSMAPMDGGAGARARKGGAAVSRGSIGNGRRRGTADGGADEVDGDGHEERNKEAEAWWKTQLAKFGSIELENKGSVARDHLALERTFLAWLRTSLSFASIGVAITQLFRLNTSLSSEESSSSSTNAHAVRHLGKPLGGVFLGISILMLFLGYHRYFQAQQWIIKGKFPASRGTVILVSLVALGLMIVSLVVVLLVQPAESGS